ncbi:MAG: hypothetical protein M0T79_11585 [Actinomycetota bacterium]|nr:hypothetical protein [Actinomycetota bacterium]
MELRRADDPPVARVYSPDSELFGWLDRCRELANSGLDGIEDPARELAELAGGDRQLMESARQMLLRALEHEPHNATLRQMHALWRRAFEKGEWTWGDTPPDVHHRLS